MSKNKKLIIPFLLIALFVCVSFMIKTLSAQMDESIKKNGLFNVESVVEQVEQTYTLQVENYYSRLHVLRRYMEKSNDDVLKNEELLYFLENWQEETGATPYFMKENGAATTSDKEQCHLEISSSLLMGLKQDQSISKLITIKQGSESKSAFLMAIPCEEYQIEGQTYTALGAVIDREEMDSLLKLYAYSGEAYLFIVDEDGYVSYTNQQDEKLFQNYSLLKHLLKDDAISQQEYYSLQKTIEKQKSGVELLGVEKAFYLGYSPIHNNNNNNTLICIVPKRVVNSSLTSYQSTVMYTSVGMSLLILTLFVCLFYSLSRISITKQKVNIEKENMKELEELNKNLKEAQVVTANALETANMANQAKTDFLSNMSHDIRTPMNAIIGITSLIEHDANDEQKVREYVQKIQISSKNLLSIINDVLDMNKIESGKTTLKYSDFSICNLVNEMDVLFRPQTDAKNQTFEIITQNIQNEWVNGDYVHIMQVLNNLLSNAVKYTRVGGEIEFMVEELPNSSNTFTKYRFSVKDNGIGMDEDFKNHLFEAFTREENSVTNKVQGTGLGMAIAKSLVDLMGGTIDVQSKKNEGSCFELVLSLKVVQQQSLPVKEQSYNEKQDSHALKGMKFLCAEDNALNAEILTELLHIEGAECEICENGQEIVERFKEAKPQEFDMILMDIQMPIMNGYEATQKIREFNTSIPIIAMTANAFSDDIQTSLNAGMNAHVSKPVDMKVLQKVIRNMK